MTIKHMLAGAIFFISTNNFTFFSKKDFVFDRGMHTEINRNSIFSYIYLNRQQAKPSYVFEHTRVVECSKDKELKEIGTLGLLQATYKSSRFPWTDSNLVTDELINCFDRFQEFVKMNNAIYCSDVEQKLNYFDKPENVGAIIYGTQSVEDCALFKEYLRQQKLAEKTSKEGFAGLN